MIERWLVLKDPNRTNRYYVWRESTYSKIPNVGFITKIEAEIIADTLNKLNMKNKIEMDGYWYEYELKAAKNREDICLATKNPEQYCNGLFLYSSKDPGSGIEFVVIDTNDPVIKAKLTKI